MSNQNSVWYVVLGAGLALITSLLVEIYKSWSQTKNNQKDYKITLKLEVKSILETITRLVENYGTKQFFPFVIIEDLGSRIQRLDKIRDKIIFIKNDIKKEEILSLFNSIVLYHADVLNLEKSAFGSPQGGGTPTPWDSEIYKSQRQMLALRGTDLKRNIQDLINSLER